MNGFSFARSNGTSDAVAAAGNSQATGTVLTSGVNFVTSSTATTADGVTLPSSWAVGDTVFVGNTTANSVDVFPASGDAINVSAADAAITLLTGECALFFRASASLWCAVIGTAT